LLTLKKDNDNIFKVLPIILVSMGERLMSYEKLTHVQSRIIIGMKQTLRAMKNGEVSEVYIAMDADQHLTQQVVMLAEQLGITCHHVDSKKKLGMVCGVEVSTSTVAIRKE